MGLKHVAFCAVLLVARAARPEPSHVAAAIHAGAAEARARRVANLAAGAISGAGFVPIGVMLEERGDSLAHATGVGLIFAGGIPLAFTALSLCGSSMEAFAARFDARQADGMSDDELARVTRGEWRALARASRSQHLRLGTVEIILGLAATVVGVGLLRHDDHVTSGSVLVGSGVPFIQLGVRGLLQPAPEEIWFAHVEDL